MSDAELVKWFKFDVSTRLQRFLFDALAATRGSDVRFVQVGANDGVTNDPIQPYVQRYGWSGVAIEPVAEFFEQLAANYAHTHGVTCVRALCSSARKDVTFFEIERPALLKSPELRGISSAYRDVIRGHFASEDAFRAHVAERSVGAVLLDDILADHGIHRVDLLVIDTEGADFDVLRGFSIQRYLPALVMLEHYHLAPVERDALYGLMRKHGYQCAIGAMDSFFYRPDVIAPEAIRLLAAFHDTDLAWTWLDNHQPDAHSTALPTPDAQSRSAAEDGLPAVSPRDVAIRNKSEDVMEYAEAVRIVRALYLYCLHRDPGPAELESWANTVIGGAPLGGIIETFGNCDEYKARNAVVPFFPPGHYYSPIVAPDEAVRAYMLAQVPRVGTAPAGIEMMADDMRAFFIENCRTMAAARFPQQQNGDCRYYSDNLVFPLGDAQVLRTMLHVQRPRQIIEIGSGFSTACMLDTADELAIRPHITCIEPYPDRLRSLLRPTDAVEIVESSVQQVPVDRFAALGSGDILFIDSTHVLKTASDVHYELFEILPSLQAGVIVHFHDLPYPFEYPTKWVFEQNYSWNEAYAVRAFLMYNRKFLPYYSNSFIAMHARALVERYYPNFPENPGTSLWIRKIG